LSDATFEIQRAAAAAQAATTAPMTSPDVYVPVQEERRRSSRDGARRHEDFAAASAGDRDERRSASAKRYERPRGTAPNAREIFDECHGRYRSLAEWLEEGSGQLRAVALDAPPSGGYQWRPQRGRAGEFVADFQRIGRQALRRPEWKGRLKLFEIYFLHSMEYREAINLVGVSAGTFDYWVQEVKRATGKEFARCGLYPPSRYFLTVRE
jgi:hypothetical protein